MDSEAGFPRALLIGGFAQWRKAKTAEDEKLSPQSPLRTQREHRGAPFFRSVLSVGSVVNAFLPLGLVSFTPLGFALAALVGRAATHWPCDVLQHGCRSRGGFLASQP